MRRVLLTIHGPVFNEIIRLTDSCFQAAAYASIPMIPGTDRASYARARKLVGLDYPRSTGLETESTFNVRDARVELSARVFSPLIGSRENGGSFIDFSLALPIIYMLWSL